MNLSKLFRSSPKDGLQKMEETMAYNVVFPLNFDYPEKTRIGSNVVSS